MGGLGNKTEQAAVLAECIGSWQHLSFFLAFPMLHLLSDNPA